MIYEKKDKWKIRSFSSYHNSHLSNSRIFIFLNAGIFFFACCIYLFNTFYLHGFHNTFLMSYLNDLIAIPTMLSMVNLLFVFFGRKDLTITSPVSIITIALVAGLFWEFVTPLYKSSTTDLLDIAVYVIGGFLYTFILALPKLFKFHT